MDVVARGANRECVRDPADPRACLKFELPPGERTPAGARERLRRWLGRRWSRFGENATELRAWRRLQRRLGDDVLAGRIAAVHGLVDTPRGRALKCELVALEDGRPAPSLYQVLFGTPPSPVGAGTPASSSANSSPACRLLQSEVEGLCGAVDAFAGWLQLHGVPLFDLNAGNLVVVPGPGGPRLVCVDAKSTVAGKEPVPLSRWVPMLRRRKVARRAERLKARIRSAL